MTGTQFCETTCHNLNEFGPAVCGTDGYTYESPCQIECTGVSLAAEGECDSKAFPFLQLKSMSCISSRSVQGV